MPWVSIFDPAVTDTATRGYYVVYLFHSSEPLVHLSLNQGTTRTREEFGAQARQVLADRAALMRRRLLDFADVLSVRTIDLGSPKRLPADYVAGHALGRTYKLDALPAEAELRADLDIAIRAYRALTFPRRPMNASVADGSANKRTPLDRETSGVRYRASSGRM